MRRSVSPSRWSFSPVGTGSCSTVVPAQPGIPGWTSLMTVLGGVGERWLGAGNALVNPVTYLVVPFLVMLMAGAGPSALGVLLARLLSSTLQSGFLEEFLFRGVIRTRLRLIIGSEWALVLQALAFGAWHLGWGSANTGGLGPLPRSPAPWRIRRCWESCFGILFDCTRNLLVPSVFHIALNCVG